ncbi:MAG: lipoprotein [Bacteroidales bacterium]|nr:lipoprotein [Bacteroidales bacterium]MCR5697461.1 lipoprotein [Marinilabiliaceae bacterium]
MRKRIIYAAVAMLLLSACSSNNYSKHRHRKKSCQIELQHISIEQQNFDTYVA